MPDEADRDEEARVTGYEAEMERTAERARAGLEYLDDAGGEDDSSGLAQSPFNVLARLYRDQAAGRPGDGAVHHYFGRQFYQVGLFEEAVKALRRAVELSPESAEAHYYLASSLRAQGKKDEARDSYRRALELGPTLFEARAELEMIEREEGGDAKP